MVKKMGLFEDAYAAEKRVRRLLSRDGKKLQKITSLRIGYYRIVDKKTGEFVSKETDIFKLDEKLNKIKRKAVQ